jgi:hypothetical protein
MDSQSVNDNNRLYSSKSPWLYNQILRLNNKAKRLNKPADWNTFRKIRSDVTSLVRKTRDAYQDKLVSRLSDDHPSTITWWKNSIFLSDEFFNLVC